MCCRSASSKVGKASSKHPRLPVWPKCGLLTAAATKKTNLNGALKVLTRKEDMVSKSLLWENDRWLLLRYTWGRMKFFFSFCLHSTLTLPYDMPKCTCSGKSYIQPNRQTIVIQSHLSSFKKQMLAKYEVEQIRQGRTDSNLPPQDATSPLPPDPLLLASRLNVLPLDKLFAANI